MLANVKIEQDKEKPWLQRVYKDGQEITSVRHVDANFDVDEIPTVNVEIAGGLDFEGMEDIHFDYSPQTVKEACKIMREELFKHGDLYMAFLASIESSLKEQKVTALPFQPEIDIADKILQRIIGEEEPHERKN